jgi:telomere length regulation protein
MEDLIIPTKTSRKIQDNIAKFETLSVKEANASSRPASTKSKISIIDISSDIDSEPNDTISLRPSVGSSNSSRSSKSQPKVTSQRRPDSAHFLRKSYLEEAPPVSLPDDAREVLKSQPDQQNLAAVLQYLLYGIEGKHDFNIRLPGPKASQVMFVLVTVTLPDQWPQLRQASLSKKDRELKQMLVSCLRSVAGIGGLLMQIKQQLAEVAIGDQTLLDDTISALSTVLEGNNVLSDFLADSTSSQLTDMRRRVIWQEVISMFAGSKIISATAQASAKYPDQPVWRTDGLWLSDGNQYAKWLAKNISASAVKLTSAVKANPQHLDMISQVLKRSLSLGYRGMCP